MEHDASFVFDFFAERHIALKGEWCAYVLSYLRSFPTEISDRQNLTDLVFQQWMYADLNETSFPILDQSTLGTDGTNHPIVLQIYTIVDISAPFHSQYNTLVFEFADDTGFEPLREMEREALSGLRQKPRRMLLLEVGDGETILRAVEYRTIMEISLLTKPGCKVLIFPPVRCRRGVLLLEPRNFQVIGGDVESLFDVGRPLAVMAKKLNLVVSSTSTRTTYENVQNNREQAIQRNALLFKDDCRQHSGTSDETTMVTKIVEKRTDVQFMGNMTKISPLLHKCSKPVAEVPPIHQVCQYSPIELEDSPPDFLAELDNLWQATSCQSKAPTTVSFVDANVQQQCPLQVRDMSKIKFNKTKKWRVTLDKNEEAEVFTLEDDDVEKSQGALQHVVVAEFATNFSQSSSRTQQVNEDNSINKFRALNVLRLAEAIRLTRFAVGSCRRIVQAIIVDIVDPLRIVDGMWTMKVTIQDESCSELLCFVDNASLTSLIGLTPKEAMEVRASSDIDRRKDGQRRLATVETQLKRLDLLLELELFSGSCADPVIRNIRTLVQALDLL